MDLPGFERGASNAEESGPIAEIGPSSPLGECQARGDLALICPQWPLSIGQNHARTHFATEGQELYLENRTDLSTSSKQNHGYRIERFVEWCEENDVDNLNNLTGRSLHESTHRGVRGYPQQKGERVSVVGQSARNSQRFHHLPPEQRLACRSSERPS